MKLCIKQKVFSFRDRFYVYDEEGNSKYYVEGKILTFGKKLYVYTADGEKELAFIHQKVFSFLYRYYISKNGGDVAEVIRKISFMRPKYIVNGFNWEIEGDFWAHDYQIKTFDERIVATISKKWFAWGDTYCLDINDAFNPVDVLSVVIVIDAVLASEQSAAASNN